MTEETKVYRCKEPACNQVIISDDKLLSIDEASFNKIKDCYPWIFERLGGDRTRARQVLDFFDFDNLSVSKPCGRGCDADSDEEEGEEEETGGEKTEECGGNKGKGHVQDIEQADEHANDNLHGDLKRKKVGKRLKYRYLGCGACDQGPFGYGILWMDGEGSLFVVDLEKLKL